MRIGTILQRGADGHRSRWVSSLTVVAMMLHLAAALHADAVLDWNALMLDAIQVDNSGPTLSSRNLAILHAAMYDAVNSVLGTHQPYRFQTAAPEGASAEAAAVGAAYVVMRTLYPSYSAPAEELYDIYLAGAGPNEAVTIGLALGRQVGQLTVENREADGSQTEVPYIPSNAPGHGHPTR